MTSTTHPTSDRRATASRARVDRDDEGTAILEFAIIAMLLLTIVFGAITYGMVLVVEHGLNAASAEGARAAINEADDATTITVAKAAATQHIGALGEYAQSNAVTDAVIGGCDGVAGARCVTVTVTYPWSEHPLIPRLIWLPLPDTLRSVSTIQLSS